MSGSPRPRAVGARGAPPRPPLWRIWLLAARPPTLPAALAPVLVGTAVAAIDGPFDAGLFFQVLAAALLIQVGVNFTNDLSDFRRGADTAARLGPPRAVAQGWLSERAVLGGAALVFAAAIALGISLTLAAGWPILAAGGAACIAAVAYTGGPWPYGYHGLGDAVCFAFFGVVAVMGSGYVQSGALSWPLAAAAVPVGCLVTAILVVNNLRDLETDRTAGKRTLAVLLGARGARLEYLLLSAAAFAAIAAFAAATVLPAWTALGLAGLLPAAPLARRVWSGAAGAELNSILKRTAQVHLIVGALIALGAVIAAV